VNSPITTLAPVTIGIVVSPNDSVPLLKASFNSILNQTVTCESAAILVNGDLSEDLLGVIENFCALSKSSTQKIIVTNSLNFGPALNKLLAITESDYFLRQDPDDISLPNRVEKLLESASLSKSDIFYSNIYEYTIEKNSLYKRLNISGVSVLKDDLFYRNTIPHSSVLFKTKSIKQIGGYKDVYLAEDYDLWLRSFQENLNFCQLEDSLVLYHVGTRKRNRNKIKLVKTEYNLVRTKFKVWPDLKLRLGILMFQRITFYFIPLFLQRIYLKLVSKTITVFPNKKEIQDFLKNQLGGPIV
jgi:hypothetical protein